MNTVTVIKGSSKKVFQAEDGQRLSDVLMENSLDFEHPCSGRGACRKCTLTVDGKVELSCRYIISSDVTVVLPCEDELSAHCDGSDVINGDFCIALDIGTTTLEAVLVSLSDGKVSQSIKMLNPQKVFGADVMSRIAYCSKNGVTRMQNAVIEAVNSMTDKLLEKYNLKKAEEMYVSGNTTMLHIFFGEDCSGMGTSPYTPTFLEGKNIKGGTIGIKNAETVVSLSGISAFVGADIVAGVNCTDVPTDNKYNLLVDLGTNAEIILYGNEKSLCTAAAAGPCFEGANISCGMTAASGAVCEFSFLNGVKTIDDAEPVGLCATGLIDLISELVKKEIIDETGFISGGEYRLCDKVVLLQEDVRQFQLAKSAVYSAIKVIVHKMGITFRDIETAYISGGFAGKLNIANAVTAGLLPMELVGKYKVLDNSSLSGTVKYAKENNSPEQFIKNAEYCDLSADKMFSELFVENMMFDFVES